MLALAATATSRADAQELRYDLGIDLSVTLGGAAVWVGSELLKKELAPARCRWCDRDASGADALNGVDRGARDAFAWSNRGAADTASNVVGFVLAPIAAGGADALAAAHDGRSRGIGVDLLVIAEAGVLAADLNQLVKLVAGRERPFVHALPPDEKGATAQPSDNHLSFFSGHTTATMAVGVAAGTVASMRGYTWALAVWAVGPTLSLVTGYLRIAADKHYVSDVLVGALVGAAVGFAVPYAFHRPAPTPGGGTGVVGANLASFAW